MEYAVEVHPKTVQNYTGLCDSDSGLIKRSIPVSENWTEMTDYRYRSWAATSGTPDPLIHNGVRSRGSIPKQC